MSTFDFKKECVKQNNTKAIEFFNHLISIFECEKEILQDAIDNNIPEALKECHELTSISQVKSYIVNLVNCNVVNFE